MRSVVNENAAHRSAPAIERAPVATSDIVRVIARVLISLTVALSILNVRQLQFVGSGDVRAGMLAAAVTIPLHIRHLIYGVRGERPPGGAWTLATIAIATFAGIDMAGAVFSREFAPLAIPIFIVVPGAWAFVLVGALTIASVVIAGPLWYPTIAAPLPGFYFVFVIIWRTATQIIPLRLLAVLRALDSANQGLEARAVVQARVCGSTASFVAAWVRCCRASWREPRRHGTWRRRIRRVRSRSFGN
ncbi:MAG TPA: hypothetical protein VKE51_35540 [Vicinamibacterales bacterium]|nr:hypothetical protein [Vicinamibacterales bacterium]